MRNTSRKANSRPIAIIEWLEPRRLLAANPVVIDLLALYTTNAKNDQLAAGANIDAEIQADVDLTNAALQNSQIPITIRLVHSQEITGYSGSGSVQTDEMHLQNTTDGVMDSALTLRNQYGADLVTLITNNDTNGGGFAQQLTNLSASNNDTLGYNAMDESSLGPANTTLAHEIGHNLGAAHARGDSSAPPGPYDYDYGYRVQGTNGVFYDDIMSIAHSGDINVPLYSNPNVIVAGKPFGLPVGNANEADLAAAFPLTAPTVAAYRSTVVADTAPPVASVYEMDPNGQTLTFTVRYKDDSAVDASGIAANNVYVTTPEGFNLGADLLSVTGGTGNSFQKFATYRVTLPTANEPLSSLHVMLRANQIKDINGNFAPAGQLGVSGQDPGEALIASRDLGMPSPTVIVNDSIGNLDFFDDYKFTLTSSKTVSVHLTGMTGNANVTILHDTNNNDVYDSGENIASTSNTGSADRAVAANLTAGVYYLQVSYTVATPYTLTLNTFTDTTPPAATMDATDVKAAGTTAEAFVVTFSDNQEIDGQTARFSGQIVFHVQLDNGFSFDTFPLFPDSTLNADNNPQNAPSYRTIYTYQAEQGGFTANDNGLYTASISLPSGSNPRVHDAAGNNLGAITLGSFRIAIGTADTTLPTVAAVAANAVTVAGPTTYTFAVTYHDNVALDATTLDGSDLPITSQNGYSQLASFSSVTAATTVGANRTATYQLIPPGGSWDYLDNGSYTLSLQSTQVNDTANNSATGGSIGTFNVHCPITGDANGDNVTNALDFSALASNYGKYGRGYLTGDFSFDGLVNSSDFALLAAKFGQSIPQNSQVVAESNLFSSSQIAGIQEAGPFLFISTINILQILDFDF